MYTLPCDNLLREREPGNPRSDAVPHDARADDARARSRKERAALREAALLARVREAMRLLEEGGKPVTQHAIATLADMSEAGLSHYPSIRTILRAVAAEARSPAPEERVVARVQEAIEALRTDGRIVTQRAVIRRVRMARETLYRYPRVEAILRHVVQGGTRRRTIGRGRPEKAR